MGYYFWLPEALRRRRDEQFDGSVSRMWNALKEVPGECPDKRKLQKLIDGVDVSLTSAELICLNSILDEEHSLAKKAILRRSHTLFDAYSDNAGGALTVLVASRFDAAVRADMVSRYDWLAFEAISRCRQLAHKNIQAGDVYHRGGDVQAIMTDSWQNILDPRKDEPVISLGTPFVNHASELILAGMFDVRHFQTPETGPIQGEPPCRFVWPQEEERRAVSGSAFLMDFEELRQRYPEKTEGMERSNRAIVVGGNVYVSERIGISYNLIAVQRQANQQVFVVIAGTYAPGTFGAAMLTYSGNSLPIFVPRFDPENRAPVITAVVKSDIRKRNELPTGEPERVENRVVLRESIELAGTPLYWTWKNNEWTWSSSHTG
jgi:hypothetical protein